MATGGDPNQIVAVSVEELASAARPGADIDVCSRQLLDKELKILDGRRTKHHLAKPARNNLTGIALSGGGIRSATFCLGVLQALARHDLLKHFDYLSTVSGGGYLGGSLTWWWSDRWRPAPAVAQPVARDNGLAEDQAAFAAPDLEAQAADPPRFGVGTEDFPYGTENPTIWRGQIGDGSKLGPEILTYLRKHGNYLTPGSGINVVSGISVTIRSIVLNLLVWLPLLSVLMLGLLWALDVLFASHASTANIDPVTSGAAGNPSTGVEATEWRTALWVFLIDAVIATVAFAILTAIYFLLWQLAASRPRLERLVTWLTRPWGIWLLVIGILLVLLLKWLPPDPPDYWTRLRILLAGAIILTATFTLLCMIYSLSTRFRPLRHASYRMRRLFEGWAAVYLTLIGMLALFGSLPDITDWLMRPEPAGDAVAAGEPASEAAPGILALLAGLVAAGAAFIRSGQEVTERLRGWGFQVSGGFTATLATVLIFFGVLLITHHVAARVYAGEFGPGWASVTVLVIAILLAVVVNANYVSLGRFYRDRLMEAFMPSHQAVRTRTTSPAPAEADAMRLHEASLTAPYHIINTNVVLINARNRRRCLRGGDSFILTRDWCGSNATGWRATQEFMNDGMTLPTAVAISGAAANPNTGVGGVGLTRSRVVSVLMRLVNLRLGYWVPHPVYGRQWAMPNHFFPGLSALLRGYHEDYAFQELSDGGHFENLGLYELIRRRVRLIVVCDGVQDPGYQFEDLQTALRRIGEDFGAKVRFLPSHPMEDLIPRPGQRTYPRGLELARRGFAVANVYYPPDFDARGHIRPEAEPARLIYLTTTLVDGLPLELLGYKGKNPDFPDQSTGDQFFDEDQFEAYRELGYRIADAMIAAVDLGPMLEALQRP